VIVAENARYMDEKEQWTAGSFDTLKEAVSEAKKLVDISLAEAFKAGSSEAEFFEHYVRWGCDPFIKAAGELQDGVSFSAWDYAKERCAAMAKKSD
jgi:hypothetical protein